MGRDKYTGLDDWPEERPHAIVILTSMEDRRTYVCDATTGERLLILPFKWDWVYEYPNPPEKR